MHFDFQVFMDNWGVKTTEQVSGSQHTKVNKLKEKLYPCRSPTFAVSTI